MSTEIRYNQFKNLTRHKKVRYTFFKGNGQKKEFETDKFYCNKDSRIKMYSMPKFMLGLTGSFFQESENKFFYQSEHGKTEFEVVV